jgi:hypothetical protein
MKLSRLFAWLHLRKETRNTTPAEQSPHELDDLLKKAWLLQKRREHEQTFGKRP